MTSPHGSNRLRLPAGVPEGAVGGPYVERESGVIMSRRRRRDETKQWCVFLAIRPAAASQRCINTYCDVENLENLDTRSVENISIRIFIKPAFYYYNQDSYPL